MLKSIMKSICKGLLVVVKLVALDRSARLLYLASIDLEKFLISIAPTSGVLIMIVIYLIIIFAEFAGFFRWTSKFIDFFK